MAKKLWGGRFGEDTKRLVEEFTKSIHFDYKLALFDVISSMLHVMILEKHGYLTSKESTKLSKALKAIALSKRITVYKNSEDIHTNIQNLLQKRVGKLALKLHTARSRNEQVVFATKLYCHVSIKNVQKCINLLTSSLHELAVRNKNIIIPGFTHMQHAQPVYLKDYLGAYIEMLKRDATRLEDISKSIKLTMGAGALAGTPIETGRYAITIEQISKEIKELGKIRGKIYVEPTLNSLDSVSDRDFIIEIINALAICAMHLSRMSEDFIIWATKEFDFIEISDAYCTGSSLMPQKKNADVLELIRGHAGRIYGNLMSILTVMKGLPLTYNRDMQLDKEPLFESFEVVTTELKVLSGLIKTLKFNKEKINRQLKDESLYATDLVYYLVDLGIPFKNAHTIVGKLVKYSNDNSIAIKDMPEGLLKRLLSKKVSKKEIVERFDPEVSVKSKKSIKR